MTGENEIRFLAHNQIDKKQWDRCVEESANGLIYAYSFYLDQMSPGWNAIVSGKIEHATNILNHVEAHIIKPLGHWCVMREEEISGLCQQGC